MIKEYISRDEMIEQTKARIVLGAPKFNAGLEAAIEVATEIPAAEVVEVVRCGKCKYGKYTGTEWFCDKHSGHADRFGEEASYHEYHSKYWFCADGERRDGGQDE